MTDTLVRLSDGQTFKKFGTKNPEECDLNYDSNSHLFSNENEGDDLVAPEVEKKSYKVDRKFNNSTDLIKTHFPPLSKPLHRMRGVEMIKPDKVYKYDGIIIKYADNQQDAYLTLFREAVIGLILNEMQSNQFVNTIGYMTTESCQIPDKEGPCMYLYTKEVIGDTMDEWLEHNFDYHDFRKILMKIFRALYKAHQEFDFTHYDLHPSNVIITYDQLEPVIIDLGTAHIKYKGGHMGLAGFEQFGVLNYMSFWICDVFKLLILCLNVLEETKDELQSNLDEFNSAIEMILRLLVYFNESVSLSWVHDYLEENPNGEVYMTYYNIDAPFDDFMQYAESILL